MDRFQERGKVEKVETTNIAQSSKDFYIKKIREINAAGAGENMWSGYVFEFVVRWITLG